MEIALWQYAIVCTLVGLAGFVDSIAGGGGIISIPAFLLAGLPVHAAIGTNKLSASMGATLTTYRYARSGYVKWKLAAICSVFTLAASSLGARLVLFFSEDTMKTILLVVLPITAIYTMRAKSLGTDTIREPLPEGRVTAICVAVSVVIGMYDGFYGPGTGTFLLLLLTGAARMTLNDAQGIAKVINTMSGYAALATMSFHGEVVPPLGIAAGVFCIIGSYIGTKCYDRGGVKIVRPLIIFVIVIFYVKVIYDMVSG